MDSDDTTLQAVELLQDLGLKEYEAKCFVGLTRLSSGTAKRLSEVTDVPRTRVYDAVRVLESEGLVEIQHSNPQRFRAVSVAEAAETLRSRYESQVEHLTGTLERTEPAERDEGPVQEVWAMSGGTAIANRSGALIEGASEEIVLVAGDEVVVTAELLAQLADLPEDVDVIVGAVTESLSDLVHERVPGATTFVSGLEWLRDDGSDPLGVGRLLLVDRSDLLVSAVDTETGQEHATFGSGFGNGLVVLSRRLLTSGLLPGDDPKER